MSLRDAAVVVVAAGDGRRLGADVPKALVEVGGQPMVRRAVVASVQAGVATTVVVHHPHHRAAFAQTLADLDVRLVAGGDTRDRSVRAGVAAALAAGPSVIAVHDAARCLAPADLFRQVLAAIGDDVVAAAPGRPVGDTLKVVESDGLVLRTRDRSDLWAVHTPQAASAATWRALLAWADAPVGVTDDLGLVECARDAGIVSGTIRLLRSDDAALKVTWPVDLDVAAALLARREVA